LSAVAPATDSTAAAALSGRSIPSARATRADLPTGRRRHALGVVVEERPAVDPGECRRRVDAGVDRYFSRRRRGTFATENRRPLYRESRQSASGSYGNLRFP
jgi:hypothetical protein